MECFQIEKHKMPQDLACYTKAKLQYGIRADVVSERTSHRLILFQFNLKTKSWNILVSKERKLHNE
jgi:hypothetical protein